MIPKKISDKISSIINDNKANLINEIKETKELYSLLVKWGKEGSVSDSEMLKIKEQLLDVLKSIPALAIFLVPFGSFIILILIKVLPFNILPSSFATKVDDPENLMIDKNDIT